MGVGSSQPVSALAKRGASECIEEVAQLIASKGSFSCFSGAGISVDSGIPDFRSRGGLWSKYDPFVYCEYNTFCRSPHLFWRFARELTYGIHTSLGGTDSEALQGHLRSAEPNAAHHALVEFEKMGKLSSVITQNIDGLHRKAGNENVIEIHGTDRTCTCMKCGSQYEMSEVVKQWLETLNGVTDVLSSIERDEFVPRCPSCRTGVLKADVTFFGEALPAGALGNSVRKVLGSPVCMVIGTSLNVAPANLVPGMVKMRFGTLVVCNKDDSGRESAHHFVQGSSSETVPQILARVKELTS